MLELGEVQNAKYIKVLGEVFGDLPKQSYIVVGSGATLSYTSKIGYTRTMHDLDVIVDASQVSEIKSKLLKMGYSQSTFIHKRMPFYKNLIKQKESLYLRFSKDEINVEVLVTKFVVKDGKLKIDLYPNVWVEVLKEVIVESNYGEAKFSTLDVNFLWAIKQFLSSTLGRVMTYKKEQRESDLKKLRRLADVEKAKDMFVNSMVGYKIFGFRLPTFLLN